MTTTRLEYKLVLVSEIHKYEAEGWRLNDKKVVRQIGGSEWSSVYMVRMIDD